MADYRFVYLGPRGTGTPLHSDVLRSNSWSANVTGVKRWRMAHPSLSWLLVDAHGQLAPGFAPKHRGACPRGVALRAAVARATRKGPDSGPRRLRAGDVEAALEEGGVSEAPCDCGDVDLDSPGWDLKRFPCLEAASQFTLDVTQLPGDALFVPSAWHHTVDNAAATLSINHNWVTAFNIRYVLHHLA